MKIFKILAILAVGTLSLFMAVYFTESYVAEAIAKEKTLAEAIFQSQLEAEIKKAEEQAKEELGTALVTTVLETKPVTTTTAATTTVTTTTSATTTTTTVAETEPPETTEAAAAEEVQEEIITQFTRGGLLPEDRSGIPLRTIFGLSEGEQLRLTGFLVDHYFLNGDIYVANETRPALKERKQLANEMEKSAIAALNLVLGSIRLSDIASVMEADYSALKTEITVIRNDFEKNYRDAGVHGEEFASLYEDSLSFLDRLIAALGELDTAAKEYKSASNPFLAGILLASAVDEVIFPEIIAVLEQSFDLVETSQEIFLEGTQGTVLLTREEVTDIIINPGLVLNTGLA